MSTYPLQTHHRTTYSPLGPWASPRFPNPNDYLRWELPDRVGSHQDLGWTPGSQCLSLPWSHFLSPGNAQVRPCPVAHLPKGRSAWPVTANACFPSSTPVWWRSWACMTWVWASSWGPIRASALKASSSLAQRPRKKNTSPNWHQVRQANSPRD